MASIIRLLKLIILIAAVLTAAICFLLYFMFLQNHKTQKSWNEIPVVVVPKIINIIEKKPINYYLWAI